MILIRVDLPAPFSPSKACTSPARASKCTPSSDFTPGNDLLMPRSDMIGGESACAATIAASPGGAARRRGPGAGPGQFPGGRRMEWRGSDQVGYFALKVFG